MMTDGRMFAPVAITAERTGDGGLIMRNALPEPSSDTILAKFRHWAERRPDAPFLKERTDAEWASRSYGELWQSAGTIGDRLLEAGCSADRPLMILAGNSIAHGTLMLAAMRVGVPIAPVSPSYATMCEDYERLRAIAGVAGPAALYADPAEAFRPAVDAVRDIVGTVFDDGLLAPGGGPASARVAAAEARVTPDTVAKLLFTSGSTGSPKGVINTQRMMASNQAALEVLWPCLARDTLTLCDWLPWNHTFGGNVVFNLALWHGGTLFIDGGKPAPGAIDLTVRNIADAQPTAYFTVPAGCEALLPKLEADRAAAEAFFSRLHFFFCAAAALPQKARDRLDALARSVTGRSIPILSGWGSTETAPCNTLVYYETEDAANIGLPAPGVTVKLTPVEGKLELRVKGPNVMPGYWRAPEATAAAFDEEGFYRMGDAGRLSDPDRPEAGLVFDGRTAENFKLRSGTWVNAGSLRVAVIDAARPYVRDAVVTGHDGDEVGLLIFPNLEACRQLAADCACAEELAAHAKVRDAVRSALIAHNGANPGSSTRIARFRLEAEPPTPGLEITDKGYINQRAVLGRRSAAVLELHIEESYRV